MSSSSVAPATGTPRVLGSATLTTCQPPTSLGDDVSSALSSAVASSRVEPYVSMPFSVYDQLLNNEGRSLRSREAMGVELSSSGGAPAAKLVLTPTRRTSSNQKKKPNTHRRVSMSEAETKEVTKFTITSSRAVSTTTVRFATEELAESRRVEEQQRVLKQAVTATCRQFLESQIPPGRAGRSDVQRLLAIFSLPCDEDFCDDFWLELTEREQQSIGQGAAVSVAYVVTCEAIAGAVAARGGIPPPPAGISTAAGCGDARRACRHEVLDRATGHTQSSRLRTAAVAGGAPAKQQAKEESKKDAGSASCRAPSPAVMQRLAAPKRAAIVPAAMVEQQERELRSCTFRPSISRAAAAKTSRYGDPTYLHAVRVFACRKRREEHDAWAAPGVIDELDVSPVKGAADGDRDHHFPPARSRTPPPLPTAVPNAYVETVARLRRAAAVQREHNHQSAEYGFWRSSPRAEQGQRQAEDDEFFMKPILRMPSGTNGCGTSSSSAASRPPLAGASDSNVPHVIDIRLAPSSNGRENRSHRTASPGTAALQDEGCRSAQRRVRDLAADFCNSKGLQHGDPSRQVIEQTVQLVLRRQQREENTKKVNMA
jgi:hypothetical protein